MRRTGTMLSSALAAGLLLAVALLIARRTTVEQPGAPARAAGGHAEALAEPGAAAAPAPRQPVRSEPAATTCAVRAVLLHGDHPEAGAAIVVRARYAGRVVAWSVQTTGPRGELNLTVTRHHADGTWRGQLEVEPAVAIGDERAPAPPPSWHAVVALPAELPAGGYDAGRLTREPFPLVVRGRAVGAQLEPLPGARVRVVVGDVGWPAPVDRDGWFELRLPAPAAGHLDVEAPGRLPVHGHAFAAGESGLVLVLPRASSAHGRLEIDEGGDTSAWAVELRAADGRWYGPATIAWNGRQGRFSFDAVPAGPATLRARHRDGRERRQAIVVPPAGAAQVDLPVLRLR